MNGSSSKIKQHTQYLAKTRGDRRAMYAVCIPKFSVVRSTHLWETGATISPPKICVETMCWIFQLAQRAARKVVRRLDPRLNFKSPLRRFNYSSPDSYREWKMHELLLKTQPRMVRFLSNLVQSLTTWHPIYNKRSRWMGQRSSHSITERRRKCA